MFFSLEQVGLMEMKMPLIRGVYHLLLSRAKILNGGPENSGLYPTNRRTSRYSDFHTLHKKGLYS